MEEQRVRFQTNTVYRGGFQSSSKQTPHNASLGELSNLEKISYRHHCIPKRKHLTDSTETLSLSLFSKPLQFPLFLSSSLAHAPTRPFRLSDFEIGRALGKGKFGRVFMARTKPSVSRASGTSSVAPPNGGGGYIVALKTLYKSELINTPMEKQLRREIEIQMNLR